MTEEGPKRGSSGGNGLVLGRSGLFTRLANVRGTVANITLDGALSRPLAREYWDMFIVKLGLSAENELELLWYIAAQFAFGTSAERDWSRCSIAFNRTVVQLSSLVDYLPSSEGESGARRWARGFGIAEENGVFTAFADITAFVIETDDELRRKLAMANECSYDQAHLSFDYANSMTGRVSANNRRFIVANRNRKVGSSRPMFVSGDSSSAGMESDVYFNNKGSRKNVPSNSAVKAANTASSYGL